MILMTEGKPASMRKKPRNAAAPATKAATAAAKPLEMASATEVERLLKATASAAPAVQPSGEMERLRIVLHRDQRYARDV